jgi:hypothetical protein
MSSSHGVPMHAHVTYDQHSLRSLRIELERREQAMPFWLANLLLLLAWFLAILAIGRLF